MFKVGDKVSINAQCPEGASNNLGDAGTIVSFNGGTSYTVRLDKNGYQYNYRECYLVAVTASIPVSAEVPEELPPTGKDALEFIENERARLQAGIMMKFLRKTSNLIDEAEYGINLRNKRIKEVEELQKAAVKLYDADSFDKFAVEKLEADLAKVQAAKIS